MVARGSVQLAYLDPPFNVGTAFRARRRAGRDVAYDDRWPSLASYLAWLRERVAAVRDLLHPEGTAWLHLDHRAVHDAKVLCDGVFGAGAFAGEFIWVPGNGAKARRGPAITHQTILLYARGDQFPWNRDDPALREPFADTSLATHFREQDDDGRRYRDRTVGGKTYRYYADKGRALGSVWTDCPAMSANTPLLPEATGYPTQKPLKLLDRILRAATTPDGGLVLDPFCGSGTTGHAAGLLGRPFVCGDIGALAIKTTARRLEEAKVPFVRRSVEEPPAVTARR